MSFAFRRNAIVRLLERPGNRRVCCRVFFEPLLSASFHIKSIFPRISSLPLLPLLLFIDFTLSSTFIQFTIPCVLFCCEPAFFYPSCSRFSVFFPLSSLCVFLKFYFRFFSSLPFFFKISSSLFPLHIGRSKVSFSLPFVFFCFF